MKKTKEFAKVALCFWAKKSENNGVFKWLPLKQHLLDTMNVSGLLWEHWLSDGQKKYIMCSSECQNEEEAKRLVKFLGAVHDIGKATPVFQMKENRFSSSMDLRNQLIDKLEQNGFDELEQFDLINANNSHHALASEVLLSNYGVKDDVGSIAGAHHGKPVDYKEYLNNQIDAFPKNYFQVEKSAHPMHLKWKNSQKIIFEWALEQSGYNSVEELPSVDQPSQVILLGLLIMADWIASNEDYFPLLSIDEDGSVIHQQKRLKDGWVKWFKTVMWTPEKAENIVDLYQERFSFEPREVQMKLAEVIQQSMQPGIFIIEAPMGVGKTEAALAAVEQLSYKTGRSGMFFGLPTQATSDGIFSRIQMWLGNIAKSSTESKSLQLVHGKSYLNKDFSSMAKNIDPDGTSDSSVIANEWFSGKKTAILDDFVVGTVDHFLLSALKQRHLALRHLGLSKKVVVIDEVHAYDAYMGQYLYRAIYWMGAYRVPVVILSATLPSSRRCELIEAYMRGTGQKMRDVKQTEGWKTSQAYPLITYSDGDSVKQSVDFDVAVEKEIEVRKIEDRDILMVLEECLSDGGIAGIVVNTVKRAQQLAEELASRFGEDIVELLHSSFISADRVEKEKRLIRMIGKNAVRPHKKIIVGTQVIEQSLDIDFDVLISDLAPMDLLLQRSGRLHRHTSESRPKGLENPVLYVLGTSDTFTFEEGSSHVYGDYLLIRTQYYLPDMISLPCDISTLVQKVYDDTDLDFAEVDLQRKYTESKAQMNNTIANKKSKAKSYLLEKPKRSRGSQTESLIGWLCNANPNHSDERGFAQVRDSGDRIEVIAVKKCGNGYSFFHECEDISAKIAEFDVGKTLASQTLKLPNRFSLDYNIDKTIEFLEKENRGKLPDWQQQPWLKGSLGIIFDENNHYNLNGWILSYDSRYGLKYEKEVENGAI